MSSFTSSLSITINLRIVVKILIASAFIILFSSWGKLTNQRALRTKAGDAAFQTKTTSQAITINGKILSYTATAGYLALNDKQKQPLANIYYTAYTLGNKTNILRPITFVFNGGPGSASIWLHMGSFGPVRAVFKNDQGDAPDNDFKYADNQNTWLTFTDMVFIDPIGTGYSQPADGVDARRFYGYHEDIRIIAQFIDKYLTDNKRQQSPKFLAGESYGGLRAIGLASYLQDSLKTNLSGLTLISPALNYQLISFRHDNETPYGYFVPSYAASAQYHHQLSAELQRLPVEQLMKKAEDFAHDTYSKFLTDGDAASPELTERVIDSLSYFTGLSKAYLKKVRGRVSNREFAKSLLQTANKTIGAFDSRVSDTLQNADPSSANIRGLFIQTFQTYVSNRLRYTNRLPYVASTAIKGWKYGPEAANSYINGSAILKKVMLANPVMKVNVVGGYYDLVTAVGSTTYAINHLGIEKQLRENISVNYYKAGHMIYISNSVNAKFRNDSEKFYQLALGSKLKNNM